MAASDPQFAGYLTGQLIVFLAVGAGLYKCWSISRRPQTNTKCVLALALFLGVWLVSSVITLVGRLAAVPHPLTALLGFAVIGLMAAAIVLAILGLVEYSRNREAYTQGRAQAIWTLVLSGGFLVLATIGFLNGGKNRLISRNQPSAGETLRFEDLNFKFESPERPWVQVEAGKLNRVAKLAFLRGRPQTYFMVIGEKLGGNEPSNDSLVEVAAGNLRSVADVARIGNRVPMRVGPLQGLRLESEVELSNYKMFYVHWVCATNGWAYQLISWGPLDERVTMGGLADDMIRRFSLIDPQRRAPLGGQMAREDTVSTSFQYRVRWQGSKWRAWENLARDVPSASFGALHEEDAALVVSAVSLFGLEAHPESIYHGLLGSVGLNLETDTVIDRREIIEGNLSGILVQVKHSPERGKEYVYRMKLLRDGGFAYMVGAWVESKHPRIEELLADGLARVEFLKPSPAALQPGELNADERRVHRVVLNGVGLAYHQARQFEQGARFFKAVVGLEGAPTNSPYLPNLVQAWLSAGKYQEGLDELELHPREVEANIDLQANRAFFQSELGRTDAALTNYARIFSNGYRDESHFRQYVGLLAQVEEPARTLAEVEKFLKVRDSADVRLLQAGLLKRQGKFDEAITLLLAQRQKNPFHAGLAYSLADTFLQANRHTEALDLSQEMIRQQGNSASAHFLRGRAEFGLKWYRQAKESFERAAREAPADADIKSFLDLVSGMLGEGENSTIKTALEPVKIPASVLTPLPPAPTNYAREHGAYYSRRVTAVSFERGRELKTTDFYQVQTLTAAGVSAFSTFQLTFNPLSEQIFINRLEVHDATGSLVSTGKVSDYYVLDDSSSSMATTRKVLNIPVSGLQPGYSVEVTLTRRELGRVEEFPFLQYQFSRPFPTRESILFLCGETGAVQFASSPRMDPEQLPEGWCWRAKEPPVYRYEPLQPAILDYLPTLWVSDVASRWSPLATNYLNSIRDRLALTADQRALARRLTASATNEQQKIAAIASYVQTNYTYKAIEFGRRARIPQLPADIGRNKYGDCKDHALLVQQMLRENGLHASLALVSVNSPVRQDLPSLDQFDHMIVHVPTAGSAQFLDCTEKGGFPVKPVPAGLAGLEALVLDEVEPRFVRVPDYPSDATVIRTERTLQPTNQTELLVQETITMSGVHGGWLREYLRSQPSASRQAWVSGLLGSAGQILTLEFEGLEQSQEPLILRMTYLLRGQLHGSDRDFTGNLPLCFERSYLTAQPFEARVTPFHVAVPLTIEGVVSFRAPAGFRIKPVGDPAGRIDHRFVNCEMRISPDKLGGRAEYRLRRTAGRFPAADYGEFCRVLDRAINLLTSRLVYERVR